MASRRKVWKRIVLGLIIIPFILFASLTAVLFWKQDSIIQELIETLNEDFIGEVEIGESHIAPFASFPYISIDVDNFKVYEDKHKAKDPILAVKDIYLGFDFWTLLTGKLEIKSLKLKDGLMYIVQNENGDFNVTKALSTTKEIEDSSEEFHIDIKVIEL